MRRFSINSQLLLMLIAFSFVLRAWRFDRMAIEHFDEGVYAANYFSGEPDFSYPDRELYAPPLFPALLEWVLLLRSGTLQALMWVNVFLGTALVVAVWWTTRQLLPNADSSSQDISKKTAQPAEEARWQHWALPFAAAMVVAFQDQLVQYSRAALTDIPLCLFLTSAVGAGVRSIRAESKRWALLAAVLTALAWWTKYNGWLPLAILGAGLSGWAIFNRPTGSQCKAVAMQFIAITLLAALLWVPCLWGLQQQGGYQRVAANHAGYVTGLSGWFASATQQLRIDRYSSGWSSAAGVLLAVLAIGQARLHARTVQPLPATSNAGVAAVWVMGILAGLATAWGGTLPVLGAVCLIGLGFQFRTLRRDRASADRTLGDWVLAAWIVGLAVATPMYRPYPRLVLPLLIAVVIGGVLGIGTLAERFLARWSPSLVSPPKRGKKKKGVEESGLVDRWKFAGIMLPGVLAGAGVLYQAQGASAWQNRTSMEVRAQQIAAMIVQQREAEGRPYQSGIHAVVYVLGEPALYDELAAQPMPNLKLAVQPASSLKPLQRGGTDARFPTYLVTGIQTPEVQRQELETSDRAELVGILRADASDLVLLDSMAPSSLQAHRKTSVSVYRIGEFAKP